MKYPADKFLWGNKVKIISFENKYRDDLIFMILEAKNALGNFTPKTAIVNMSMEK